MYIELNDLSKPDNPRLIMINMNEISSVERNQRTGGQGKYNSSITLKLKNGTAIGTVFQNEEEQEAFFSKLRAKLNPETFEVGWRIL